MVHTSRCVARTRFGARRVGGDASTSRDSDPWLQRRAGLRVRRTSRAAPTWACVRRWGRVTAPAPVVAASGPTPEPRRLSCNIVLTSPPTRLSSSPNALGECARRRHLRKRGCGPRFAPRSSARRFGVKCPLGVGSSLISWRRPGVWSLKSTAVITHPAHARTRAAIGSSAAWATGCFGSKPRSLSATSKRPSH